MKYQRKKKRRHKRLKRKAELQFAKKVGVPRSFRRRSINGISQNLFDGVKVINNKKERLMAAYLPVNLKYLLSEKGGPFYLNSIKKENFSTRGHILVPDDFSILDNEEKSYLFLRQLIFALLLGNNHSVILDYEYCKKVELSSQVLLDIILKDYWVFSKKVNLFSRNKQSLFPTTLSGINIIEIEVKKLLFSVGSPAIFYNKSRKFEDIIPYKLCIHDNEKEKNLIKRTDQKELDTTVMADYVIDCLKRMNKKLTGEKLNDLCTVIGEILINAEEHSTTKFRYSIGYFKEENGGENHFGVFRLVILNFGRTIYEKFKSDDCPNQDIVNKMRLLSQNYTKRNYFTKSEFEEENLWTLYALQEGVTSIPYVKHKRGNGSIRFIESFFNIKGSQEADDVSRMSIVSGRTRIVFDGKYNISSKINNNGDTFKIMTFNDSGSIEDKPDNKYVYCMDNYFPGTYVSAKILLNDDDVKQIKA